MTTDLQMLTGSALLCLAQGAPYLVAVFKVGGGRVAAGNRDDLPPLPAWADRAARAQKNMVENLLPFTALVLVVHVSGLANAETAFGSTLFFASRLAYAVIYVAGIAYLRTVAFVASLAGMFDLVGVILRA
ncbi:MAG: MAPEG family protein [Myxococcota bacterium]